uniref:Uncharacterized protein n=1 Tax=Arundo donax TaxID=35708 RepID=A0A0A9DQ59_ARUDO
MGESDENHSSCISDWQCTKHEFMNNPLEGEFPCSATVFRKSSPAKPEVVLQNTGLYHAYSCAIFHEGQRLLAPKYFLPATNHMLR